jgi:hypothetical protein
MKDELTIALSDRRVSIDRTLWPQIGKGSYSWHDGQVECQANRKHHAFVIVRQNFDGRILVYGKITQDSNWPEEGNREVTSGRIMESNTDYRAAVRSVGRELIAAETAISPQAVEDMIRECLLSLPVEVL